MFEKIVILVLAIITWFYAIMCLIRSREIEVRCDGGSNTALMILYAIFATAIVITNKETYYYIVAFVTLAGGLLFSFIPSGFNSKCIYLRGRKAPYDRIKDMKLTKRDNDYQLSFTTNNRKYYTLFARGEDGRKLNTCMSYWRRGGK